MSELNDLTEQPSSLERSTTGSSPEDVANQVTKFRLDEVNKIKDYLNAEIKERKDIVKKISKYIVAFDYADKLFITLSASFGTLSIVSHATVVGIPVGIAGASLTVIVTVTTGVVKKILNITRKKKKKHNKIITLAKNKLNITSKKKKKHNKIITLAKNKLNIIESLISQALTDFDISHQEFSKIIYEKNSYEQMKDNIRSAKSINDLNKENDQIF